MGLVAILLSLASLPAAPESPGGPIPEWIEKFLEACESSRRGAILQLEHELRGLSRKPPTAETAAQIAIAQRKLRVLHANERLVVPQLAFPPQVGAIGRLPRLSCHVEQIVSDREVLVRCDVPVVVRTVRNFTPLRETVIRPVRFLLVGVRASDFSEGSDPEMLEVFEIVGKRTYQIADGTDRDVHVLQAFDMDAVKPYLRRRTGKAP